MSYINNALRKAQSEKDSRYLHYGGIISPVPGNTEKRRRKKRLTSLAGGLVALLGIALGLSVFSDYFTSEKGKKSKLPHSRAFTSKSLPKAEEKIPPDQLWNLYEKGLREQKARDLARAEETYLKILAGDPRHVHALNNLGVIYLSRKKHDQAAEAFKKAIALKQDYVDPYYNLACLYSQLENKGESLRYLKAAIALNIQAGDWAKEDSDLNYIRTSPEFLKLLEKLNELRNN